ncbi:hypothetical protein SSTU70S_00680 [Stutzerimonas stutzeri]
MPAAVVGSRGESLYYPGVSAPRSPPPTRSRVRCPGWRSRKSSCRRPGLGAVEHKPQFSLGGYVPVRGRAPSCRRWAVTCRPPTSSARGASFPQRRQLVNRAPQPARALRRYRRAQRQRPVGCAGALPADRLSSHPRYHDKSPAGITTTNGMVAPRPAAAHRVPINYYEHELTSLSFSTRLGNTQVSGDGGCRPWRPVNVLSPQGAPAARPRRPADAVVVHPHPRRPAVGQPDHAHRRNRPCAGRQRGRCTRRAGSDDFTYRAASAWQSKPARPISSVWS